MCECYINLNLPEGRLNLVLGIELGIEVTLFRNDLFTLIDYCWNFHSLLYVLI